MRHCVDSDTNSLTQRLAGTFSPTEALYREAGRAEGLLSALFEHTLSLLLDALRAHSPEPLPGPAPGWEELSARWSP